MKVIFVIYIILWCITAFLGVAHQNDKDKDGNFKPAYWWIVWFFMTMFIPVMAKLTGLI